MTRARKSIAVIITAMITSLMLTSCSFVKILNNGQPLEQSISEHELARLLTFSIKKPGNVASYFSSIPASQLDSVSYSTFAEYTTILRNMSKGRGDITAFRILGDKDRNKIVDEVSKNSGIDVNEVYPDEDIVEIIYDDDSEQNVYFPLKRGENASLDGKAMADTIASYNYIFHYMNMVYHSNSKALVSILEPVYSDDIYIDSVIRNKADHIIDYYSEYVTSGYDDIKVSFVSPCLLKISLPKVDNGKGKKYSKEVSIINRNGEFLIEDKMPVNPTNEKLYLYKGDKKTVTAGDVLSPDDVRSRLGEPLFTVSRPNEKTGMDRIVMCYNGMDLAFEAAYDESGNWTGSLYSIRIFGQGDYKVDNGASVGMNISELMVIYPFIDDYDYMIEYEDENGKRSVSFERDDFGNIVSIIMK
ncbi:MAG: hypothetical protein K5643_07275 [Saccharofermentans sp.]|nr:hypothetical protein [Saccharofermentans sp.]